MVGMWEKVKEALPAILISFVISLFSAFVVFWGHFSSLSANVLQNSEDIKMLVKRDEFRAVLDGQRSMSVQIEKRMDRIEDKVDRINERLK